MARYVVTAPCVITPVSYALPGRTHVRGQVIELTASEYTARGGASVLRAAAAGGTHQRASDVAYERTVFGEDCCATRRNSRYSSTGPTGR